MATRATSLRQCRICGVYDWFGHHKCKPKWETRVAVTEDEADLQKDGWYEEVTVYARDPEEAAEMAIAKYEVDGDNDYEVGQGRHYALVLVVITDASGDQGGKIFHISGHMEPVYTVNEVIKEAIGG